jgi:hypothetical protein
VLSREIVPERHLYRLSSLRDDNAAEVLWRLRATAERDSGIESPKRSRPEARVQLIGELPDIDGVVSNAGDGRGKCVWRCDWNRSRPNAT